VSLVSLSLDAGLTELRILVIKHGSKVNLVSELQHFNNFHVANYCVVIFAVRYSSNPLSKKCHFGHVGGVDPNMIFIFQRTAPVTTGKSKERPSQISNASMLTLRKIISDNRFESDSRALLRKPDFFFDDLIEEDEAALYDGDYKWLCQIGNRRFFLLNTERMYPLVYLQHMFVCRTMRWELVKPISGVTLGKIGPVKHTSSVMEGMCWDCILACQS